MEVVDGIWHLRSHDLVKQVLRAGRTTQQAGFNSDMARAHTTAMKDPILFMDGDEHRRQVRQRSAHRTGEPWCDRSREITMARAAGVIVLSSGTAGDRSARRVASRCNQERPASHMGG